MWHVACSQHSTYLMHAVERVSSSIIYGDIPINKQCVKQRCAHSKASILVVQHCAAIWATAELLFSFARTDTHTDACGQTRSTLINNVPRLWRSADNMRKLSQGFRGESPGMCRRVFPTQCLVEFVREGCRGKGPGYEMCGSSCRITSLYV